MAINNDRQRVFRPIPKLTIGGLLLAVMVLGGCASISRRTITERNAFHSTEPEQVTFPADSTILNRDYVNLGNIEIKMSRKKQAGWTIEQIQNQMREKAAALGAEAVIHFSADSLNEKGKVEHKITFHGIAVRFIDIYTIGDIPKEKYEILGKVWVSHKGSPLNAGTRERILGEIRPLAANLGANAIMDFYASIQDNDEKMTFGCWGSGLAIRYVDKDSVVYKARPDFIVGIRPWTYLNGDENNPRIYLGDLVSTAQYYLEQNGFHAFISESPVPIYYLDKLDSVRADPNGKANELQILYGPETELILLLDLAEPPGADSLLTDSATIRARLFSKSTYHTVWENKIEIDRSVLSSLFDGARGRGDYNLGAMKLYDGAQMLFANLPTNSVTDAKIRAYLASGDSLPEKGDFSVYTKMKNMFDHAESFLLYEAVSDNNLELTGELLKQEADINTRGYNDYTMLHTAVANGYIEMTEFLLKNGADINLTDGNGLTPLQLAEKMEKCGYNMARIIGLFSLKTVTAGENP